MAKIAPNKFRVSSALKTIIGKELITDDFIAVFELVKNAFDAHAKRVNIIFNNLYSEDPNKKPSLIIQDNGKGMDLTDIVEKWLFVAYSAKKEGVEDYRDKIQSKRIHAGSKGIGRFSCDKIGTTLTMYTKKVDSGPDANKLVVDWTKFEEDSKKEFITVPVDYDTVQEVPYKGFNKGTIIVIEKFREGWDREKLLKLRQSLEKLINPNQENDPRGFSIYLTVKEELENDKETESKGEIRKVINGKIENKIFEDLEIKTTKIDVVIPSNGRTVQTILEDRGTLIYDIVENNPYEKKLRDIRISLFVLNRSAKMLFTKNMGIHAIEYGSVFLYKNGFRIYPFGEPGQDTLKIDHRKQQGTRRFFGTRDIIGRIEINGENLIFQETSSRDGGLIRNKAYDALEEFFLENVLKRLEKFAIGVIKWGNDGDLLDHEKLDPAEMKKKVSDIVYHLTTSKKIIDINYNLKLIDILQDRTEGSLKKILGNLQLLAEQSDSQLVAKEIRRAQRQYNSLMKAKEEAEKGEKEAKKDTKAAKEAVEQKETQNLFLKAAIPHDVKFLDNLCHSIGMYADGMNDDIRDILSELKKKEIKRKKITAAIKNISYHANTISSLAKFVTRAKFRFECARMNKDLILFIREHLLNVATNIYKKEIRIKFDSDVRGNFVCEFRPIEITILLDNLISNSIKNKARSFVVNVISLTHSMLKIGFSDDGRGVPTSVRDCLFEEGITTTSGSGLGLYHVKEIITSMKGKIEYNPDYKDGAQFIATLRRES
jgi:signal transduction histidine kinase